MLHTLHTITSPSTNPYRNIALEAWLLEHVSPGEVILYLWQNRRTVVVGRNQNARRECDVERLEADGGHLARRLSGGGAVFHDMGNLNFTFLARKPDYDVNRQLEVILEAVRSFGIRAEKTGRNDIAVDGRKFSGNAFYDNGGACYHHGTLLLDTDGELMSRYLNVSKDKLRSKGVKSVKSRVVNLAGLNPAVTVDAMKQRLAEAFSHVYALPPEPLLLNESALREVAEKEAFFSSFEWKYGRRIPFEYECAKKFDWGEVQVRFHVNEGKIQEAQFFSDALETTLFDELRRSLPGVPCQSAAIASAVLRTPAENTLAQARLSELADFLRESV